MNHFSLKSLIFLSLFFSATTFSQNNPPLLHHFYGENIIQRLSQSAASIGPFATNKIKINKVFQHQRYSPRQLVAESSTNLKIAPTFKITKEELFQLLNEGHQLRDQLPDRLVPASDCDNAHNCTTHKVLGYHDARVALFGSIHLQKDERQQYFIKDIYCLKNYTAQDFRSHGSIGPMQIPEASILNTEHVWPQSRFHYNPQNNSYSKEEGEIAEQKKSDLHILYPSNEELNGMRGSHEFADVAQSAETFPCSEAKLGHPVEDQQNLYFEPPKASKGNVARAIFYFSVKYNAPIRPVEEKYLRLWNKLDPVDDQEIMRNNAIYELEHIRNPFIDQPQWVDLIADF